MEHFLSAFGRPRSANSSSVPCVFDSIKKDVNSLRPRIYRIASWELRLVSFPRIGTATATAAANDNANVNSGVYAYGVRGAVLESHMHMIMYVLYHVQLIHLASRSPNLRRSEPRSVMALIVDTL